MLVAYLTLWDSGREIIALLSPDRGDPCEVSESTQHTQLETGWQSDWRRTQLSL